jgi:hypothetical protein
VNLVKRELLTAAVTMLVCLSLQACRETPAPVQQTAVSPTSAVVAADDQEVLTAQKNGLRDVSVTFTGPVLKVLPDDSKGSKHQRWLMQLSNGTTVLIAHNLDLAPRVPFRVGDSLRIHGDYIWNNKGGVVHWTHRDPRGRHEGGWIEYNGQRYQ